MFSECTHQDLWAPPVHICRLPLFSTPGRLAAAVLLCLLISVVLGLRVAPSRLLSRAVWRCPDSSLLWGLCQALWMSSGTPVPCSLGALSAPHPLHSHTCKWIEET